MMFGEIQYNEYVFVTQYNYDAKYALRDNMLKHLALLDYRKDTFGSGLLKESTKEIRENLRMMKTAGFLEEWNDITAKISEHGINFIEQGGYKGLQIQSDEEIVFRFLHDHKGGPIHIDEIKEVSGLDFISILDIVDNTSDRIVFRNDDNEIGIKEIALDHVGSILKNRQFDKLKKKVQSNASVQIGDTYNLQGVNAEKMTFGNAKSYSRDIVTESPITQTTNNITQAKPNKFSIIIQIIYWLVGIALTAIGIYKFVIEPK